MSGRFVEASMYEDVVDQRDELLRKNKDLIELFAEFLVDEKGGTKQEALEYIEEKLKEIKGE